MFGQVMSTVVNALLSIPPIRFVMGLVDARWRPLWAVLWLAVITYILSRTMNQLALRRARLRLLSEPPLPDGPMALRSPLDPTRASSGETGPPNAASPSPSPAAKPAASTPPARVSSKSVVIPLPVVVGAVTAGAVVVAVTAVALRPKPNDARPSASVAPVAALDSTPATEGALDVKWRSGRMSDDNCIGTFEVTRGSGTRAAFVAFVMDSSGAIMARDSARVDAAVAGLLVDFRFRHVDCDEIADWQLQATTPKVRPSGSARTQ